MSDEKPLDESYVDEHFLGKMEMGKFYGDPKRVARLIRSLRAEVNTLKEVLAALIPFAKECVITSPVGRKDLDAALSKAQAVLSGRDGEK